MYDTYNLQRADIYFEVLQVLRIFSYAIRSSPAHRASLTDIVNINHEECGIVDPQLWARMFGIVIQKSADFARDVHEVFAYNWKVVISRYDAAAKSLLERVERKTEKIKSLRDGVRYILEFWSVHMVSPWPTPAIAIQCAVGSRGYQRHTNQPISPGLYHCIMSLPRGLFIPVTFV